MASGREPCSLCIWQRHRASALQNEGVETPDTVRVEGEKVTPETEQRTNTAPTNEMADIEPMLAQKEVPQNVMSDTRISDALANMGSENEKATFGERLADNVKALNDVLTGKNRLQPAYSTTTRDGYSNITGRDSRTKTNQNAPVYNAMSAAHKVGDEIHLDGEGVSISNTDSVQQIRKNVRNKLDDNYRNKNNITIPNEPNANMNKVAVKKFVSGNDIDGLKRMAEMTDDIPSLMELSKLVESLPDYKNKHAFANEWEKYITERIKLSDGKIYDLYTKVAVDNNGNRTLYSQKTKESPFRPVSEQSSYRTETPTTNISQTTETVNPTQSRFAQNTATNRNFSDETRKALKTSNPQPYML